MLNCKLIQFIPVQTLQTNTIELESNILDACFEENSTSILASNIFKSVWETFLNKPLDYKLYYSSNTFNSVCAFKGRVEHIYLNCFWMPQFQ